MKYKHQRNYFYKYQQWAYGTSGNDAVASRAVLMTLWFFAFEARDRPVCCEGHKSCVARVKERGSS